MTYDCIIVGGGIAGLQAAIQLGRYEYKVLVIDSGDGRSTLCRNYHNILGYPDGVSGEYLRDIGKKQAEGLGIQFLLEKAEEVTQKDEKFEVKVHSGESYSGKRLLIATGVMDRIPEIPELYPCLGISIYVCPDCDGFEVKNQKTIVLGSGEVGANMATTLTSWTKDIHYINHEQAPVSQEKLDELKQKQIFYYEQPIQEVKEVDGKLQEITLKDGTKIHVNHGFIAFGNNEVKSSLAKQLGVELLENKHILVDPRSKMTNIKNVWAAGDVVAHSEQVTIALGDGMQAAIFIHKSLKS
ncbi:NAD(P)/FAD-dependent oxidoreductase [Bacillus sp. 31A1R]|uniref:NAD(P)/FAD-dependent oxidoreductase n=1 Tax=Robertmurraya mangrovi TaxID=3098077 RepID=A0ABU5IX74_9BACI|nr:NAD(P)/FAD-dependent oxidoreductase [Bacillus sp. 31A1R]MDZ5471711.1 NAD(P)/FAD-dependent oxidoreductase [Bacillus sp. 31A1R]